MTTAREEARHLIDAGYYQISREYRLVVRLPTGKTGSQALLAATDQPGKKRWVKALGERNAGDHYLRVYAPKEDRLELSPSVFAAFRQMGGDTYSATHDKKKAAS